MSNDIIDFKSLWQQQPTAKPNLDAVVSKLKKYKKKNMRKMIFSNIILTLTAIFIAFVWYYYQPQFITTKLGIILSIIAMIVYLFFYNGLFASFKKIDTAQSNQDYLHSLQEVSKKQHFLHTTLMSVYYLLLAVGIGLYLYEYVQRMTLIAGLATYLITFAWIAFNWFYTRPKVLKKQNRQIDELILKFEELEQQLRKE